MNLQDVLIASFKNIFFGIIALALFLPLLLSIPAAREYLLSVITLAGLNLGD